MAFGRQGKLAGRVMVGVSVVAGAVAWLQPPLLMGIKQAGRNTCHHFSSVGASTAPTTGVCGVLLFFFHIW